MKTKGSQFQLVSVQPEGCRIFSIDSRIKKRLMLASATTAATELKSIFIYFCYCSSILHTIKMRENRKTDKVSRNLLRNQ